MAAPAAAEVPVLAYLVVGLLGLLMFAVCVGLRAAWINTFGVMLTLMADALDYDKWVVHIHLGGPFRAIDHTVQNALHATGVKFQHSAGYFFHGAAVIQGWAAKELLGLAKDTYAWMNWFQHSHLPRWLKAAIYAAVPPLLLARLVKAAIHAQLPHLIRTTVINTSHTVTHTVTRIIHATAGAVALPGWVIRLPHRLGRLEADRANIWKRLRKLEKYAGATGAVALFVAALGKLGLKWLRCRNVTKVGKRVCAMDSTLLDALLLETVLVVGAVSVVQFAEALLSLEDEAVGVLGRLISEFPEA